MAIRFSCEACSRIFSVGDDHESKRTKCPFCAAPILVPRSIPPEPRVAEFLPCLSCGELLDKDLVCRSCKGAKPEDARRSIGVLRRDARLIVSGLPGDIWINSIQKPLYQLFACYKEGSGVCVQYDRRLARLWAIPHFHGCECKQKVIKPGELCLPFVDFLEILRGLDLSQKHAIVGKGNWEVFEAGLVPWSEIVTPGRVREFNEVMARNRLTVPQMVAAGVPEDYAQETWDSVYTPEMLEVMAKRREIIQKLKEHGLSFGDISKAAAERLAGRVVRSDGGEPEK
jgi:hypothetical protein